MAVWTYLAFSLGNEFMLLVCVSVSNIEPIPKLLSQTKFLVTMAFTGFHRVVCILQNETFKKYTWTIS